MQFCANTAFSITTAWVSLHNTRKNNNCRGPGLSSQWPLSSWEFWFHSHSSFPVLGPFPSALRILWRISMLFIKGAFSCKRPILLHHGNLLYAEVCPQVRYFFFLIYWYDMRSRPLSQRHPSWSFLPFVKQATSAAFWETLMLPMWPCVTWTISQKYYLRGKKKQLMSC